MFSLPMYQYYIPASCSLGAVEPQPMVYGYHLSNIQHRQLRWVSTLYRPSNPPVGHPLHGGLGLGNLPKTPETFRFGIYIDFPTIIRFCTKNILDFRKQPSSGVVLHQYHCAWMSLQVFAFDTSGGHGRGLATRRYGRYRVQHIGTSPIFCTVGSQVGSWYWIGKPQEYWDITSDIVQIMYLKFCRFNHDLTPLYFRVKIHLVEPFRLKFPSTFSRVPRCEKNLEPTWNLHMTWSQKFLDFHPKLLFSTCWKMIFHKQQSIICN